MLFSAYSRYFKPRFLCFFWSSLMTGACHHLRPAAVFYDDRPKAQKAVQYSVFFAVVSICSIDSMRVCHKSE